MRTIETKVFTFDELSDDAKQTAIEQIRNQENSIDLYSFKEQCEDIIANNGFTGGIELQYSLSYSQGDGLSFSCDRYDFLEDIFLELLGKGKERTAKTLAENTTFVCKSNNNRYCFASKSDIDMYLENWTSSINTTDTDNIDKVITAALEVVQNKYLKLCKELEDAGYDEIEYQDSDEFIIETIEANEYEFTEEGKMF